MNLNSIGRLFLLSVILLACNKHGYKKNNDFDCKINRWYLIESGSGVFVERIGIHASGNRYFAVKDFRCVSSSERISISGQVYCDNIRILNDDGSESLEFLDEVIISTGIPSKDWSKIYRVKELATTDFEGQFNIDLSSIDGALIFHYRNTDGVFHPLVLDINKCCK